MKIEINLWILILEKRRKGYQFLILNHTFKPQEVIF